MTFWMLSFGSSTDVPYAEIESAFSKKNAESITKLGSEKLIITILGKESVYSSQQAVQVFKDFFNKHPLTDFKFIFKGKEDKDGSFGIASYSTKNENFRFTFHFKKQDSNFKIIRITIEKD